MNWETPDPESQNGRLMMGVGGLLFIPISVGGIWGLFVVLPSPESPLEWCFRIFFEDLAITAAVFFTVGFLWALTGSRRLKYLMDSASVRLAWFVFPLVIPIIVAIVAILIR